VRTRIYMGAERFVDELHARWQARRKPSASTAPDWRDCALPTPGEGNAGQRGVYQLRTRTSPAVQLIKAGLEAAGITTWFDFDRLGSRRRLRSQDSAQHRALFLLHSRRVSDHAAPSRGYFRREWSYAIDRVRNMADGRSFILPVTIDGTSAAGSAVPDKIQGR